MKKKNMFYTENLVGKAPTKTTTKKRNKPMENASPIHGSTPVPAPKNVTMKTIDPPAGVKLDAILHVLDKGTIDMLENMCRLRIMFKIASEKGEIPDQSTVNEELQQVVGSFNEMTEKIDDYMQGTVTLGVKEKKEKESSIVNKIF